MSIPIRLVSTLFLLLITSSPAWARVINLGTATPVPDRSSASVARALQGALDGCVRQAAAMGLPWIRIEDALSRTTKSSCRVIATDAAEEAQRQNMAPVWRL